MTEKVLVIPATEYKDGMLISDLKDVISKHGSFLERPAAEIDTNYLQIIPYIVVKMGNNIFTYQRLKKGTESRLHAKYSIGIGGHINEEDAIGGYGWWPTVEAGAYRELHDELIITEGADTPVVVIDFTPLIIYDPSNEVGKVHLGIVGVVNVSHCQVTIGEPDKIAGEFINELKLASLVDKMETWSQIVMANKNIWST